MNKIKAMKTETKIKAAILFITATLAVVLFVAGGGVVF